MPCSATLNLLPASGDQPMDAACYNSTDGNIYGIRGGRIFRLDPNTGAVLASNDVNTRLLGGSSSICYDAGTNTLWVGGWNDPSANIAHGNAIPATFFDSPRQLYKVSPASMTALNAYDIAATFPGVDSGGAFNNSQYLECGVRSLLAANNRIYAGIASTSSGLQTWMVKFNPAAIGTQLVSYSVVVGGQFAWSPADLMWGCDVTFPRIVAADMNIGGLSVSKQTFPPDSANTFFPIAIEYSTETSALFLTSQDVGSPGDGSWIYRYTTAPAEVLRFNLGRPAFNGVHLRRCPIGPNTGQLFAAGFGDNTVAVITPAGNSFVIKTGFDLAFDFVFTPTKAWAVQQGSAPLKLIT